MQMPARGDQRRRTWLRLGGAAATAAAASLALLTLAPPATPTQETIALVTDAGELDDGAYNALARRGLRRAQQRLGVRGQVYESDRRADYGLHLSQAAQAGSDLTFAVGFDMAEAVNTVAGRFPASRFAIVDVSQADLADRPANVRGMRFRSEQAGCLVGYLAAKVLKAEGRRPVLSAVGGMRIAPVDAYIAGYRACAKRASRRAKVLVNYADSFTRKAKCRRKALAQIRRGSRAVFQVAGGCGRGALGAAKAKRRWGIGVDFDQSSLGRHVLTSAVKQIDEAVYRTIRAVQRGSFRGGEDAVFGLKEKGVGYAKPSRRAARRIGARKLKRIVAQVERLKRRIIRGKVNVPAKLPR